MIQPQITTLLPTFRRPEKLKAAIESVLAQSYPHFRLHVCDNCSGDETADVVRSFQDKRIHYVCRAENMGFVENFRQAMLDVQTDYFSFLCDDDRLEPSFYEELLAQFAKNHSIGLAVSFFSDKKADGRTIFHKRPVGFFPAAFAVPDECYFCAILFSKKVLAKVPSISPDASYFIDLDYVTRCLVHFPSVVINKNLVERYSGDDNISNSMENCYEILEKTEARLLAYISREAPDAFNFYKKHYYKRRASSFWKMLVRKKYQEAEFQLGFLVSITSKTRISFYKMQITFCRRFSIFRNFLKLYHRKLRYQEKIYNEFHLD